MIWLSMCSIEKHYSLSDELFVPVQDQIQKFCGNAIEKVFCISKILILLYSLDNTTFVSYQ